MSCNDRAVTTTAVPMIPYMWKLWNRNADGRRLIDRSAFYVSLGGSYTAVNFGSQDIIAIGTSTVTNASGVTVATGYADGPDDASGGTPIDMDALVAFAPSIEVGFIRHLADHHRWIWGAKFTTVVVQPNPDFSVG